jgi:hypothetical protein
MTLKIGLMHIPKRANRFKTMAMADYASHRPGSVADSPTEFLIRLREARRRMRRSWKGI